MSLNTCVKKEQKEGCLLIDSMDRICKACAADPMSHSFKKISEKNGLLTYYCHPAQAKRYDDTDGFLSHVDNLLSLSSGKGWRCIVNGEGMDLKHASQFKTGEGLMRLFTEKHGKTMKEVVVINPTWHIKGMITVASTIMEESAMQRLRILSDRPYSVFEFV